MKDKFIMKDSWDDSIYYIGYTWEREYSKKEKKVSFNVKSAALSIHIDDIESVFGEEISALAQSMKQGDVKYITIEATEE